MRRLVSRAGEPALEPWPVAASWAAEALGSQPRRRRQGWVPVAGAERRSCSQRRRAEPPKEVCRRAREARRGGECRCADATTLPPVPSPFFRRSVLPAPDANVWCELPDSHAHVCAGEMLPRRCVSEQPCRCRR